MTNDSNGKIKSGGAAGKPQCKAVNRSLSGRCRGIAVNGGDYCSVHLRFEGAGKSRNRVITAHVDDDLADWVKWASAKDGLSMTEWFRDLIEMERMRQGK